MIRTHDPRDTGAMLYQLSYEALPEAGQERGIHIISLSSYNGYKLNSLLTCFQRGFIAQLVEHRTGIAEVMGSNPVEASYFFLGFFATALVAS